MKGIYPTALSDASSPVYVRSLRQHRPVLVTSEQCELSTCTLPATLICPLLYRCVVLRGWVRVD